MCSTIYKQVSRWLTCAPQCASKQVVNLRAICAQKYDSVHAHSAHALHVLRALQYSHFPPAIRTRISLVQGNYVG